jgi:hypothetical protein
LYVQGTNLLLTDPAGHNFVKMVDNGTGGTVTLYHDNSAKLATTSTGINVTGGITTSDNITMTKTNGAVTIQDATNNNKKGQIQQIAGRLVLRSRNDASNGNISFEGHNSQEYARFNSSGYLGLGTSSPQTLLDISHQRSGTRPTLGAGTFLIVESSANPSAFVAATILGGHLTGASILNLGDVNDEDVGQVSYHHSDNSMRFKTNASERMRVDSSGNVIVGATSQANISNATEDGISLSQVSVYRSSKTTTTLHTHALFINPNGNVGSITTNGSSTSYITTSDYRLKENVTGITDGIERVKQLNPSRFNFIADADTTVDGFLAHEAATVVPEAVTGEKDAVDEDGNPEYQGIDQAKLVPLLTAALQEAITKIEDLEARVATLEGN